MNEEEGITQGALDWVKSNRDMLIERFASAQKYESDLFPTTVFMAGSPGAGKTEVSKHLVDLKAAVRIDADEIRELCPAYSGENAHLFQLAASTAVHYLFDHVVQHKLNVVVDGTFAHAQALPNIKKALKKGYAVEIAFVYQDPITAWDFTKKREVVEKRRITKERFIAAYFNSRENVVLAKKEFGQKIKLNLFIKDFEKGLEAMELDVDQIDSYIKKNYSENELKPLLI